MDYKIIDPSTLTEEQRQILLEDYKDNKDNATRFGNAYGSLCQKMSKWYEGRCDELTFIFGEEFFTKGR